MFYLLVFQFNIDIVLWQQYNESNRYDSQSLLIQLKTNVSQEKMGHLYFYFDLDCFYGDKTLCTIERTELKLMQQVYQPNSNIWELGKNSSLSGKSHNLAVICLHDSIFYEIISQEIGIFFDGEWRIYIYPPFKEKENIIQRKCSQSQTLLHLYIG